jgi:hypothetical protein
MAEVDCVAGLVWRVSPQPLGMSMKVMSTMNAAREKRCRMVKGIVAKPAAESRAAALANSA